MKKILFLLLFNVFFANAQTPAPTNNQYGTRTPFLVPPTTTTKIDVNGGLKVNTTIGTFVPPKVTTTQKNAISSPESGATIFDTTLNLPNWYNGSNWVGFGTLLTADELAAIQNANAPNAGNPFATIADLTIPNLQQVTDSGNSTTNSIQIKDGTDTVVELFNDAGEGGVNVLNPSNGTSSGLQTSSLRLQNSVSAAGTISTQDLTSYSTLYKLPEKGGLTQTFAMLSDITGFGTGTVNTVSVVSANGFAGSVSNPTTSPAVTIRTTVTGIAKGNGTGFSAATPETDYTTPTGAGALNNKSMSGVTNTFSNIPKTAVSGLTTDLSDRELLANKQNSLAADGTGNKYITVDAVRKLSAFANLEIYPTQSGTAAPTLTIVNNPTAAVLTSTYVDIGKYEINSDLPIFANSYPNADTQGIEYHGITEIDGLSYSIWYCYRIDDYTMGLRTAIDQFGSFTDGIFTGGQLVTIKLKL